LLFKQLQSVIAKPLTLLVTQLFSVGVVPEIWKQAIISPIFKKGATSIVANYRPVSLTCVASKIMERVIVQHTIHHLHSNKLLSISQHGFIKGRFTCTNLLEAINHWTLSVQNKKSADVAYIDFSRAFDSVSHEKTVCTALHMAFRVTYYAGLKTFLLVGLTSRSHQMKVVFVYLMLLHC